MNWFKSFWQSLTEKRDVPRVNVRPPGPNVLKVTSGPHNDPMPHLSNFTPRAQQVLALSRKEATRFNHNFIGTEHVLLGLVALGQGTAVQVLNRLGINLDTVRTEVEKQVGKGPDQNVVGNVPYTPRVKKVLALASRQARALNHTYVGTEHILLGLLEEGDGMGSRVLASLGLNVEQTRQQILVELNPDPTRPVPSATGTPPAPATEKPKTSPITAGSMPPRPDKQPHYVLQSPVGETLDTNKPYDVYCSDFSQGVVVYRKVRFKSLKQLFPRSAYDTLSGFVELEQANGQTVFISRSSIVRFCAPGTTPDSENVSGQKS
jgi:hypothetical protein